MMEAQLTHDGGLGHPALYGENMALDYYIQSGGKRLRCGFTTGTCAALAAAGAATGLLTGVLPDHMSLMTPAGIMVEVPLVRVREGDSSVCGVRKDAGDDRDATDGILIVAEASHEKEDLSDAADGFHAAGDVSKTSETVCPEGGSYDDPDVNRVTESASKVMEAACREDTLSESIENPGEITVRIEGGPGVGRVTKPGLDQPVGAAAINSTPRRMITDAVRKVCEASGYEGTIRICISVPDGEKIAAKTFNGHLGIEGGISILGTSGIVKPMSMQAYIDAMNVEIRQQAALGKTRLILTPGNYGKNFLQEMREKSMSVSGLQNANSENKGLESAGPESAGSESAGSESTGPESSGLESTKLWSIDSGKGKPQGMEAMLQDPAVPVVMCSNFIGDALDSAGMHGFCEVLLAGHIGKMVKLAGGIMNTHSMYADCRTELFCAHAAICGARTEVCRELMSAATTDACLGILEREGLRETVMESLMTAICSHISGRVSGKYRIHVLVFSNVYGILGSRTV